MKVDSNILRASPKPNTPPTSTVLADKNFSLTQVRSHTLVFVGTLNTTTDARGRTQTVGWTPYPTSSPPDPGVDGLYLAYWNATSQLWELRGGGNTLQLADLGA